MEGGASRRASLPRMPPPCALVPSWEKGGKAGRGGGEGRGGERGRISARDRILGAGWVLKGKEGGREQGREGGNKGGREGTREMYLGVGQNHGHQLLGGVRGLVLVEDGQPARALIVGDLRRDEGGRERVREGERGEEMGARVDGRVEGRRKEGKG